MRKALVVIVILALCGCTAARRSQEMKITYSPEGYVESMEYIEETEVGWGSEQSLEAASSHLLWKDEKETLQIGQSVTGSATSGAGQVDAWNHTVDRLAETAERLGAAMATGGLVQ